MRTPTTLLIALTMLATSTLAIGCVSDSSTDKANLTVDDEYAEAIPDQEMLALSLEDDGQAQGQQALRVEQGLEGQSDYSRLREHTVEVLTNINNLRKNTHETLRTLVDHAEASAVFTDGDKTCRRWVTDGPRNRWELSSCKVDARAKKFAFTLRGRPLAADDEAYLPVFAGEAIAAPRYQRARRGRGVVAYDFDNIATLTGEVIEGKLVVAYRANGPTRQLNIGLKEVAGDGNQPYSALFRFNHIVGRGGSFHYLTSHDFLTHNDLGEIVEGSDGLDEHARAAVAWTVGGAGRTAHVVCGGTLGEACYRVYQCWTTDGEVSWEEILDGDGRPNWERTSCADVPFDVDQPMSEDDMSMPADDAVEVPDEI